MEVSKHAPGSFCWTELTTSDGAAAKRFYGGLFGWEYDDMPIGEGMVYSMAKLNGKTVGALCQQTGYPPHWQTYVTVPSTDETVQQAKSLGGKVVAEPMDVFDAGRMAVIEDPQGAVCAVWEPRAHQGAQLIGDVGSFCWHELDTRDVPGALEFYTKLFHWTTKRHPSEYVEIVQDDGTSIGGIMAITPQMGSMPPHWLPYVTVASCDACLDHARGSGAQILVPGTDVPDVGRFGVIRDPQGAVFAIIAPNHQ